MMKSEHALIFVGVHVCSPMPNSLMRNNPIPYSPIHNSPMPISPMPISLTCSELLGC